MSGTEQVGKRRRRFFAARLGIEEEHEDIPHTCQVDIDGVPGEMRGDLNVSFPQWHQSMPQIPVKTGLLAGEAGLHSSTLELSPPEALLPCDRHPAQPGNQEPSCSGLSCFDLDWFAGSQSTEHFLDPPLCHALSQNSNAVQPLFDSHSPWKSPTADAFQTVMDSFVDEDFCWEALLGDLNVNSCSVVDHLPASALASPRPAASTPGVTCLAGTDSNLVLGSSCCRTGPEMLERQHSQAPNAVLEGEVSQLSGRQQITRMQGPVKDTEIVASCQSGQPLGRRGDSLQQLLQCNQSSRFLDHGTGSRLGQAEICGKAVHSKPVFLTACTTGGGTRGCLQGSGGGCRPRGEIPSTSWMLLGGHLWEMGLIPDLTSLAIADAQGDCAAGEAGHVGRVDELQATHSMEKSRELVCKATALSERLKATLDGLQERLKKRKLVEGNLSACCTGTNHRAQSGPLFWVSNKPINFHLQPDVQGNKTGGRVGVTVAAGDVCPLQGMSLWSVPETLEGSGFKNRVLGRLLQAAAALEDGKKAQFLDVCSLLRPHAKRTGTASQRVMDLMLKMLTLRADGEGAAFLKKPARCTAREAEKGMLWHLTALPTTVFSFTSIAAEIIPKLAGKPKVHIVSFGDIVMPYLPILVRMLSSQTQGPGLKSLTLTTVSYFKLLWPNGKSTAWACDESRAARALSAAAADCELEFEYQRIEVEEGNMEELQKVEHKEGVAVAALCTDCLKNASDNVGKGALKETMKCLVSLRPLIVAVTEVDLELSQNEFVPRFMNAALFLWEQYQMHDMAANDECRPIVHKFEQFAWACMVCTSLACEGSERRMWPKSRQGWQDHFESWGFVQKKANPSTLYYASAAAQNFPGGYAVERSGSSISLLWRGVPMHFASCFLLRQ